MYDLKRHLDSDEQLLLYFKSSRRAYMVQYVSAIVLLIISIVLFFSPLFLKGLWIISSVTIAFILFILALGIMGRIEYLILSRRYALTNERLLYSQGVFSETFQSARYAYVTDVSLFQTLWDKIMNTGTVKVNTAGSENYEFTYSDIPDPFNVTRIINDHIPSTPPVGIRPDLSKTAIFVPNNNNFNAYPAQRQAQARVQPRTSRTSQPQRVARRR